MNRKAVKQLIAYALILAVESNCGVEVGNPHGSGSTTKPTAAVSIALADAPVDSAQHVYLTLDSMSLVPLNADGSNGTPIVVALAASGQIDALALQNGKSLDLIAAQALPTGNYSAVILELASTDPASIVVKDGSVEPLSFANSANQIVVSQQFQVVDGQPLSLLLHLDLRRSITANSGGAGGPPFGFAPVASLNIPDNQGQITGSAVPAAVSEVCAYLFRQTPDNDEGPLNHPGPPPGGTPPPGGMPFPANSVTAQPPPSFDPGATFNPLSDTSACAQAFATASVASGAFSLDHLWPGSYQLVFYNTDGTRSTTAVITAPVGPGQNVLVTVPATGTATASGTATATATGTGTGT